MSSKAKKIEQCTTLLEIEVPKDAVAKAYEEVYLELAKIANIPGFRVGKAPTDMVKKQYAKDAKEEVLKRLIPQAYTKALEEQKIRPIGLPEITDVNLADNAGLLFNAKVDTRPDFRLKDYKGIKITKKKAEVSDDDVEKTLQSLREMNAKFISAPERPVQMGDYVVSDLECFVDGKPAHKKRENLWLFMEKDSMVPGLAEKMVGMQKGSEIDAEIKLREDYPDKAIAGKLALYHVKAKEIKLRQLPEPNDEFAKDIGQPTMADARNTIRKELLARAKITADTDMENQLVNKLAQDNVFPVPSGFVARQLDFMVEDSKRHLVERGFKREDLDKKDNEFKERFKDDAAKRVRLLFILDDIAKTEHIDVNDKELEDAYKAIAAQSGKKVEEVKDYYLKDEDLVEGLRDRIREEKTIRFLLEKAQVTET